MTVWRQVRAALMLPVTVTVALPTLIVLVTRSVQVGWGLSLPLSLVPVIIGMGILTLGLLLLVVTVRLFIRVGKGTLAPWDPTQRLVVVGIYRHVRNPMISGVIAILLGEALVLGSLPLLVYTGVFVLVNAIYIPLSEEPGLLRRFQEDYRVYQRNVPRWIPRLKPWTPPWNAEAS